MCFFFFLEPGDPRPIIPPVCLQMDCDVVCCPAQRLDDPDNYNGSNMGNEVLSQTTKPSKGTRLDKSQSK